MGPQVRVPDTERKWKIKLREGRKGGCMIRGGEGLGGGYDGVKNGRWVCNSVIIRDT